MKSNDHLRFLDAAGELPLRIREFDWTTTPLGPPDAWPQSLKTTVGLMLRSKFPTFITWGTERIVLYNDAYRPILGTQKHPTALGARLHDIWQEVWNDIEPIILASERTQATSFEDFPLRLLRNGYWEQAYFTFSYSPIFDESGVLCGLHCTCFETTERKSHDDEQERDFQKGLKSREELGELSDSIPQLVWMTGPNGRSEYFNRRWLEYTGVNANQGVQYEDILHPDDIEATRTAWQTSVQTGKPFLVEYRLKHKATGQYRWFRVEGTPTRGANGEILKWFGTCTDIDNEKRASLALEESNARYKLIFDASPLPKWIVDEDTQAFIDVNQTALDTYGYSREEFLSMRLTDLAQFCACGPDTRVEQNADGAIPLRRSLRQMSWHRKKDGTLITTESSSHRLNLKGRRAQLFAVIDVTERIRSEEKQQELMKNLQLAREEAERASQLKSAFLANMSHEIRTPLGAMIGFADLLRDPSVTASERTNYLDILARNGEQLSFVINDILDISKVEAGHLKLEILPSSLERTASDVMSLLDVKAKEKDLVLEYVAQPTTPQEFHTDPVRMRQVLLNLVGNAIKFTPSGRITLRSSGQKGANGKEIACFEITDTGIGIPHAQRESIFEMFVQADGSVTRRFGGTGLGLALSRKLARALGGDVTVVDSSEGNGSTFRFTIEDRPDLCKNCGHGFSNANANTELLSAPILLADNTLEGVRVLIVDDAPDNRHLIRRYLQKQGAEVDSAENGDEGFKKALSENFDIVLMDIQMPTMDGYTATQRLRENGYNKPVIALTAHAMSEVRKKCLNVGCNDHLTKPINSKDLVLTIARHITSSRAPREHGRF